MSTQHSFDADVPHAANRDTEASRSQTTVRCVPTPYGCAESVLCGDKMVSAAVLTQHIAVASAARFVQKYPFDRLHSRQALRPRHAYVLLCRFAADFPISLPEIGRGYDRNHTTVMSNINRAVTLFTSDAGFAQAVQTIEQDLIDDGWALGNAATNIAAHAEAQRRKDRARGEA